jgi:deoxyribose-phosphate aldolase
MPAAVGPRDRVKASGGIRSLDDLRDAEARREIEVGTSPRARDSEGHWNRYASS